MVMLFKDATRAERDKNLRSAAEEWIQKNPAVYKLFVYYALQMAEKRRRFGVALLAERVRWECHFVFNEGEYKINNNHKAYIARRLVEEHPHLKEFISFRTVRY